MNHKFPFLLILLLNTLCTADAGWMQAEVRDYNPEAREELIAHEWGTKLNVQGADGTIYDGLYFKKEHAVPDFVYRFEEDPPLLSHQMGIVVKPVLYFYADEPIEVRVTATCIDGSWLEWYPIAVHRDLLSRSERARLLKAEKAPSDDATNGKSIPRFPLNHKQYNARELFWWGEIIPPQHEEYKKYSAELDQEVPKDGWYPITRETDSALFRARFDYPWANQVEKFLFYRGSSNKGPNLKVKIDSNSSNISIKPTHQGSDSQPLFFIDNTNGQNRIIRLNQSDDLLYTEIPLDKQNVLTPAEAKAQLSRFGQDAGLYKKEAEGMAKIWAKDYFEKPGRRLLYRIGPKDLDKEQQLSIEPVPKELVRFQIGWLELPSDEKIAQVKDLVRRLEAGEPVIETIKREGFIAHPFMWELRIRTEDADLKTLIFEYFTSEENSI